MLTAAFLLLISNGFLSLRLGKGLQNSFPKPLTDEEERELLNKWTEENDIDARNKLIEHNLRLVAHIVKKYYSQNSDTDDLISIGTIGLIKGIGSYKQDKNVRLATYCSRCIENEILMHFRNNRKSSQDVSLNEAIDTDKDGNPLTLIDVLAVDENFADELDLKIKSEKLADYIKTELDARERKVIIKRYGLDGNEPLTQREVAKAMGISRSYISRIEKKALQLLRRKYERG